MLEVLCKNGPVGVEFIINTQFVRSVRFYGQAEISRGNVRDFDIALKLILFYISPIDNFTIHLPCIVRENNKSENIVLKFKCYFNLSYMHTVVFGESYDFVRI